MPFSQTSKAGLMFLIYLQMASHQRVLPFSSSHAFASCTDLGILTPNLCLLTQYFDLSFPMMRLLFVSTCRTHNVNTGSHEMRRYTKYLAICTGYEFFVYLKVTHVMLPSFHCTRTSTPFDVSLPRFVLVHVVMNSSCSFTSVLSYPWSTISWNTTC